MPITSVRNNENNRKRNAEKKAKTEKNKGDKSYIERVRVKLFRDMREVLLSTFGFLRFKVASKRTMNLLKGSKDVLCDPCVGPLPLFF